MKKKIYKFVSIAFIAMAMVVSVQMSSDYSEDEISIVAMAKSVEPIGQICSEGMQYTGGMNFVVLCSTCELNCGYKAIGSNGTCFAQ